MWTRVYSKTFQNVKKEDIWRIWTDINNWTLWHDDLDYCKMDGVFEVGNHFMIKPKGIEPVKVTLTKVVDGESFTYVTSFFGAKLYYIRYMEEMPEGLKLTSEIVVTGLFKWLCIKFVAQHTADTVQDDTESLVKLARASNV